MMMLSIYSGSIITFRESIFFFTSSVFCYKLTDSKGYIYWPACRCCTVRVDVPYELLYRMKLLRTFWTPQYFLGLRTEQFLCPIYSTPFDVSYVPYEIIQSDRPITRNGITFDPDRILGFWIDDWTGNFHAHWFSSRAAVQQSYLQRYFRSS